MANHSIKIDCSGMTELSLNIKMKELLGFPDFYGMNWDAMIDCLSIYASAKCRDVKCSTE